MSSCDWTGQRANITWSSPAWWMAQDNKSDRWINFIASNCRWWKTKVGDVPTGGQTYTDGCSAVHPSRSIKTYRPILKWPPDRTAGNEADNRANLHRRMTSVWLKEMMATRWSPPEEAHSHMELRLSGIIWHLECYSLCLSVLVRTSDWQYAMGPCCEAPCTVQSCPL